MAATDRDTIRALLTDTVTLLCRNSLPFDKTLKVQGLLGITVDETEVYIVQIDEEYGGGILPETMVHSVPPRTRVPVGRIAAKRPRMVNTARTPIRRVAQTVPRRMGEGMSAVSPGSALARQKVRQQLNFPTPQKIPRMAPAFTAASPGNSKPMFARESPMGGSQGSGAQNFSQGSSPGFQQGSSPGFQQSPRMPPKPKATKFHLMEDKKKVGAERLPAANAPQMPRKPILKSEIPDSFGHRPVKVEQTNRDIICVESDEENSDVKRMQSLMPFSGNQQSSSSSVEGMVDDKTVALQAIMAQALDQARAVSSGCDDNYRGRGLFPVKPEAGLAEMVPRKTEPVSSSQSIEAEMIYDPGDGDGSQFQSDFCGGIDMKPVFDNPGMQISWDLGDPMQPMPSMSAGRPVSRPRFAAQSPGALPWIKTEDDQLRGMMGKSSTAAKSPFYQPPGRGFSSPQQQWGMPGMHLGGSGVESADDLPQDGGAANWKSVTAMKFICSINNCDKEFTTKRSMRRHQKNLHGVPSHDDDGGGDSDSESMQQDNADNWKSVTTTRFICSIDNCNKEFTTKRSMSRHQKNLHGTVSGDADDGNSDASSSAAFQCDILDE